MGGIAVKKGNSTISYTGTEYQFDAGEKHLYIRTGLGANDIISYPLTTETSASQYCNLAFKVGDQTCYIAKKELRNLVFNTLPTENVSSTNSNTQAVYLDSQTYIDSNNGFATTTYNRYSTQTNYSLRNSANQTYTSTNFIINTEGITNSSSQTYTIQQIASQFLTSTSNSSATSYRTDDTWPGMPIYSSTTYYLSYDTAKNWYYTTSRSNYTSTYVNNTGYGTTTSSSKSTAYLMQNSYQTSYAGSTASGNVLHFWAYDTSMYTHSNGYTSTTSDARTSVLTNNSDYNYLKNLSAQGGATYSVYGNFTGGYRVDDWIEEPTGGIGQTYYSGNIASGTSQFESYSVRRTTYYGTSLYNSTVGSTSVSCKVTKTSYGTQRDGYPSGATSMGRTTGQVQTGYTPGYYKTNSTYTSANYTGSTQGEFWYDFSARFNSWEDLGYQNLGSKSAKTTTYSRSDTWYTESVGNSTKSSKSSPPNYGYGALPYWSVTSTTTSSYYYTDDPNAGISASYKASYTTKRGITKSSQWNAKVNSTSYTAKANLTKATLTTGSSSVTYYVKTLKATGNKTEEQYVLEKYAYSTSSSYSYSSTYTQEGSVSTGRTVRDRTYLVFTSASTYSSSAPAYQRVTYQTVWYSNNLSSQVDYQTSSIQTYYSYQSRYTQTSSTKYSSYSNRTYYISSTNFTFTKTTSSHNANI